MKLLLPILLSLAGAASGSAMYAYKPAAEEKCEWRKMRRHHPRRCVTPSGAACPVEMCSPAKKKK